MRLMRRAAIGLIAIFGLVASFAAFRAARIKESHQLRQTFHGVARNVFKEIERTVVENLEMLHSVQAFYAASRSVERDAFRTFVASALIRQKGLKAVAWVPRVTAAERTAYEAAAQADGFPNFHITELFASGQMISASARAEYFPNYFLEPYQGNELAMGFDLATDAKRLAVLTLARDSGELVITAGVTLVQYSSPTSGILALIPIYKNGLPHEAVQQRRERLVGFAVEQLRMDEVVTDALSRVTEQSQIGVELIDVSAADRNDRVLYRSPALSGQHSTVGEGWKVSDEFLIGGRSWKVSCVPLAGAFTDTPGRLAWVVLLVSLIFFGLLTMYLRLVIERTGKVETLVSLRTAALIDANRELAKQVADREAAERALREEEEKLQRVTDAVPGAVYQSRLTPEGTQSFQFISQGCRELFGFTPEQLRRDSMLAWNQVVPEDVATLQQTLKVSAETLQPWNHEFRIQDAAGRIKWIRGNSVPEPPKPDGSIAWNGIMMDVTESKQTEKALLEGEIQVKEKARALERSVEELGKRERVMRSLLDDLQDSKAHLESQQQLLESTNEELKRSHEELKAAQLQVIQAAKLESVGRLAAGVAHEVKNPLAIILMGIAYLSQALPAAGVTDEELLGVIKSLDEAIRRADGIIKGLLDFSASKVLDLKPESLTDVIERTLTLVKHELTKSNITVVKEVGEHLPPLPLDRTKMEQVFVNLFVNAVHAMPPGGTLTIRAYLQTLTAVGHGVGQRQTDRFRVGERAVVIEVDDNGQGIPEDKLSKVFDPFFTTKAPGKGTGLGLSVTRNIIELHGGVIDLRNRPEGGVRVSILLHT